MKALRIGLHSLVLVVADVSGIAAGAAISFRITGAANQYGLQLPLAVVLSIACFCVWLLACRRLNWTRLLPVGTTEPWVYLIASFAWAPLVFVPVHYITQGYLTALSNLVALALYQAPTNTVAVLVARVLGPLKRQPASIEPRPINGCCQK